MQMYLVQVFKVPLEKINVVLLQQSIKICFLKRPLFYLFLEAYCKIVRKLLFFEQ